MKKMLICFAAMATILTGFSLPATASASDLTIQVHSSSNDHGRYNSRHGWKKPGHHDRQRMINPGEVKRILFRQGYRTQDIRKQRNEYYVRARAHNGRQVMLIVNAYSGKIVGQRMLGRPHYTRT